MRDLSTPADPDARAGPRVVAPMEANGSEPSAFARLTRGFATEADQGERTVHRVLDASSRAVPLDPASLLALQAGIYRYGETMDLAARLVDKVSSGAKTILQGS